MGKGAGGGTRAGRTRVEAGGRGAVAAAGSAYSFNAGQIARMEARPDRTAGQERVISGMKANQQNTLASQRANVDKDVLARSVKEAKSVSVARRQSIANSMYTALQRGSPLGGLNSATAGAIVDALDRLNK